MRSQLSIENKLLLAPAQLHSLSLFFSLSLSLGESFVSAYKSVDQPSKHDTRHESESNANRMRIGCEI